MKRFLMLGVVLSAVSFAACPGPEGTPTAPSGPNPVVEIDTSMGTIKVELDQAKAPITVKNFLSYVDDKHYDGTVFHRVMGTPVSDEDFMIQGGGFKTGMQDARTPAEFQSLEKETKKPIKLEVGTGLSNTRGTIAMARTSDPNSATAQFFINVADNRRQLDHPIRTPRGEMPGYAVFGKVIDGMDVVDKIKSVKTRAIVPGKLEDIPVEDVVIKSIRRVEQ